MGILTTDMIMEKDPCVEWTRERVERVIGEGKTLLEILSMEDIVIKDRIWCATRFMSDTKNKKFAVWCARQCKTKVKEIIEYINTIEKFYEGKATQEELGVADRVAEWEADRAVDKAAELVADRAADSARGNTADNAAYRASYRAADNAAHNQMRRKQIKWLKENIEITEEDR